MRWARTSCAHCQISLNRYSTVTKAREQKFTRTSPHCAKVSNDGFRVRNFSSLNSWPEQFRRNSSRVATRKKPMTHDLIARRRSPLDRQFCLSHTSDTDNPVCHTWTQKNGTDDFRQRVRHPACPSGQRPQGSHY